MTVMLDFNYLHITYSALSHILIFLVVKVIFD